MALQDMRSKLGDFHGFWECIALVDGDGGIKEVSLLRDFLEDPTWKLA